MQMATMILRICKTGSQTPGELQENEVWEVKPSVALFWLEMPHPSTISSDAIGCEGVCALHISLVQDEKSPGPVLQCKLPHVMLANPYGHQVKFWLLHF